MNAHPGLGRPHSSAGSVGAPTDATLSPVSSKGKRRRIQEDSSPGSGDDGYDANGIGSDKRRQPGVKRACNECRQQKVSQERGRALYTNICRGKNPHRRWPSQEYLGDSGTSAEEPPQLVLVCSVCQFLGSSFDGASAHRRDVVRGDLPLCI